MKFRKFAASSLGKKYFERGWACQDYSDALDFENVQIIAVADGHGSSDCFRSEIGSRLAVEILFEQIKKFCETSKMTKKFSDTGIKKFKFEFVSEWKNAVKKDWFERLKNSELGAGEIRYKSVSEKYKNRYISDAEKYLYNAYGTTLICAVSIGEQILILQIGDGSCVVLQKDGEFKIPVPPEENNFLNVTVSLCEDGAELKIRHAILDCKEKNSPNFPVAIFLSTDGLDDCFPYYENEKHLYKFYSDVLIDNILQFGFDSTDDEIKSQLLPGMTKKFSQDDISLAYFIFEDLNLLQETYSKIDKFYKSEKISESVEIEKKISEQPKKVEEKIFTDTKVIETKNFESKGLPVNFSVKNFSNNTATKILRANEYQITTDTKIIPVYKKI